MRSFSIPVRAEIIGALASSWNSHLMRVVLWILNRCKVSCVVCNTAGDFHAVCNFWWPWHQIYSVLSVCRGSSVLPLRWYMTTMYTHIGYLIETVHNKVRRWRPCHNMCYTHYSASAKMQNLWLALSDVLMGTLHANSTVIASVRRKQCTCVTEHAWASWTRSCKMHCTNKQKIKCFSVQSLSRVYSLYPELIL